MIGCGDGKNKSFIIIFTLHKEDILCVYRIIRSLIKIMILLKHSLNHLRIKFYFKYMYNIIYM